MQWGISRRITVTRSERAGGAHVKWMPFRNAPVLPRASARRRRRGPETLIRPAAPAVFLPHWGELHIVLFW